MPVPEMESRVFRVRAGFDDVKFLVYSFHSISPALASPLFAHNIEGPIRTLSKISEYTIASAWD